MYLYLNQKWLIDVEILGHPVLLISLHLQNTARFTIIIYLFVDLFSLLGKGSVSRRCETIQQKHDSVVLQPEPTVGAADMENVSTPPDQSGLRISTAPLL